MNLASVVSWSMFFVFLPYEYYLCLIISLTLWTRRIFFATLRHEMLIQGTPQRMELLDLRCWLHHHPVLNEWISSIKYLSTCCLLKCELVLDMESPYKFVIWTYSKYLGIYYLKNRLFCYYYYYSICAHTCTYSHMCHSKLVESENNFSSQFSSMFTWVSETELSSPGLGRKLLYRLSHLIFKAKPWMIFLTQKSLLSSDF